MAGNGLGIICEGLPFVFWAGLSVVALLAFLFVAETGRGRQRNYTAGN